MEDSRRVAEPNIFMSQNNQLILSSLKRLQSQTQAAISAVEMGELKLDHKPLCLDGWERERYVKNTFKVGDFVIVDRNIEPRA